MFDLPPAPRMSGPVLRSVVRATSAESVCRTIVKLFRKELGIDAMRALPASFRAEQPLDALPLTARQERDRSSANLGVPAPKGAIPTIQQWTEHYKSERSRPDAVVERTLAEVRRFANMSPTMPLFCTQDREGALRDAQASAERWARGKPLGPLDGVVIPLKEEVDLKGIGARLGTSFIPSSRDAEDSTVAARLRAAGAILIGHTQMTEYGMSPLGANAQRAMPRNAHSADRLAGGSSTGSAVAVAVGLAPVALGSDGGGSIRIPACFNGVFGLKPTFGRISRHGDAFGGTMDHLGPLGASVHDLALFLEAVGGPDPADPLSLHGPEITEGELVAAIGRGVKGLKIGVLEREMDAASREVRDACQDALRALEKEGAQLIAVELPLAHHASAIGYLSIGIEAFTALLDARRHHWEAIGPDLQLLLRMLSVMPSDDYLDAQRMRASLRVQTAELLREVDVLALPTTASIAARVTTEQLKTSFADSEALAAACRFAFLGNLTGLPAGTAPVGVGDDEMPVGLQIVGDAFDEATVLQVMGHLERIEAAQTRAPRLQAKPLG